MHKSRLPHPSRYYNSRQVSEESPRQIRTAGMVSLLLVTLVKLIIGLTRSAHKAKSSSYPSKGILLLRYLYSALELFLAKDVIVFSDSLLTQAGATPLSQATPSHDHVSLRATVIGALVALTLFTLVASLVPH